MTELPDQTPTVIGLVTAGLAEVKEAVNALSRDLHSTLAKLPNEYVPRREVERRLDEMTIDIAAEKADRQSSIRAVQDAATAAQQAVAEADTARETERITARRWATGLAIATAVEMTGVLAGIFMHFN